jgi:transcriptional regulator with XRE-family HTH domain
MSQFDTNQKSKYVEFLRKFLNMKKQNFKATAGLKTNSNRKGRLPTYPEEAIKALENAVNAKAGLCEIGTTTVGERYILARDYKGYTDAHVAREFGVSRELIRRWGIGLNQPTKISKLAKFLDVPEVWLAHGDAKSLPADSHIGVRVGDEARRYREELYSMTVTVIADLPEESSTAEMQVFIENTVMTQSWLVEAARRAGGRWQVVFDHLYFAPWVPFPATELTRRYWSDEVEEIIREELINQRSVYAAWHAVKERCESKGWKYPKMISLHKRNEKDRERINKFGINFELKS